MVKQSKGSGVLMNRYIRKSLAGIGVLTLSGSVWGTPAFVPVGTTITSGVIVIVPYTIEGAVIPTNSPGYALEIEGSGLSVHNSGTISGNAVCGVIDAYSVEGFDLINSGLITTNLTSSPGTILGFGSSYGITIENSGIIRYSGAGEYTIDGSNSSRMVINNSGIIEAGEIVAIDVEGATQVSITNSGLISTGLSDVLALSGSVGTTLSNSGTISAGTSRAITGNDSEALHITNTGTISALSETVVLNGDSSLANSGTISASIAGQNALHIYGNDTAITLNRGSRILGGIVAEDGVTGATLTMNHGAGVSYAYTTSGIWTLADLNNRPVVTGSAISAGVGAQETADKLLFQRTTQINDSFATRLNNAAGKAYWVTPYAAHLSRESDDATVEAAPFRDRDLGVSMGKALDNPIIVRGHALDVDVVVNASSSHLNVDDESQSVRSSGVLAGLLIPNAIQYRGGTLAAKALVGYVKHRGDRTVITNTDTDLDVTADYHSLLAILGAEGRWSKALRGNLHGRFTAGLDVSAEAFSAYSESQYFSWDERTLTQLSGHLDGVVTHHISGNKASIFGGLGIMGSAVLSGKTNNYQINQTNVSFSGGHMSDIYGRVQGGVNYQLNKTTRMTANVDFTQSIHNISKLQGYLGIAVQD